MKIDHKSKTVADRITALGELQHAYYHAKKSAGVMVDDPEAEGFFQIIAEECRQFRRDYQAKHFSNCPDELWCLGKAVEEARQRIYESDEGDSEDIRRIDNIWSQVWGRISGLDLSGCVSCADDRAKDEDTLKNEG